jgi:hypothetical protein
MDYYDSFHPTLENDYDVDFKKTKTPEIRGLHKIQKHATFVDKTGQERLKNVTVKVYSSGDLGSNIRNAEYGTYTPYIVGSKYENLFFSVLDTTIQSDLRGGSVRLFYESPEQYESHQFALVDEDTRARWYDKRNFYQKEILREKEEKEKRSRVFAQVVN